jgi:hypothetical protein
MEDLGEEEINEIFGTEPITTFCVVGFSRKVNHSTFIIFSK